MKQRATRETSASKSGCMPNVVSLGASSYTIHRWPILNRVEATDDACVNPPARKNRITLNGHVTSCKEQFFTACDSCLTFKSNGIRIIYICTNSYLRLHSSTTTTCPPAHGALDKENDYFRDTALLQHDTIILFLQNNSKLRWNISDLNLTDHVHRSSVPGGWRNGTGA